MLFNSYAFVGCFLPLVLAGFAAACRIGPGAAKAWLVTASLLFYGSWNPSFVPLLLASVAGNVLLARLIQAAAASPRRQSALLTGGITVNLGALIACKYLGDVLDGLGLPDWDPLVPLGISFFTFTQIGLLLDCRAGLPRRPGMLDQVLLVTFFPSLIAGPILTAREVLPQLAERRAWRLSAMDVAAGSGYFLIGLLKKTLLADPLAATVASGFADPAALSPAGAWQVALSWSVQLYFDFSGYSDMAIGLARMFGLRFPANFDSPYKAGSVIEYWQRWHMTLTRLLTGSVHAPLTMAVMRWRRAHGLGTGRAAQRSPGGFASMLLLPLVVTMGLAGIWHGLGATFALFGLLHAAFLAVNHAWRIARPGPRSTAWQAVAGRVALTYGCVLVGAVLFRAPSVAAAADVLTGMAGLHPWGPVAPDARALLDAAWLAILLVLIWVAPNTWEIMEGGAGRVPAWQPTLPWAAAFGCAATLGLLSIGGTGEFLYFRF